MENISQLLVVKKPGLVWATSMILVSYVVFILLFELVGGGIYVGALVLGGHQLIEVLSGSYQESWYISIIFSVAILLVGIFAVKYGVNYVLKKRQITFSDSIKVSVSIAVIFLLFFIPSIVHSNVLEIVRILFNVFLISAVVYIFLKKSPNENRL